MGQTAAAQGNSPVGDYPPIGDYRLVANCRSAALISRDGSIDWLCFPRFDSPSIFAARLDPEAEGRFRIRPAGAFWTERRCLPDMNIIETTFHSWLLHATRVTWPEIQVLYDVCGEDGARARAAAPGRPRQLPAGPDW